MKKALYIIIVSLLITISAFAQTTHTVCQQCEEEGAFKTITAAIAAAEPGDIINIWGERDPENYDIIFEYLEHLIIDKPLTLTCDNPESDLGYPIITHSFTGSSPPDAIIHIQPGGEKTVIKHLDIRGPIIGEITYCGTLQPLSPFSPLSCMDTKIGILVSADDCTVHDVSITRCMTGIYLEGTDNYINGNRIGNRWLDPINPDTHQEEYWSPTHNYQDICIIHHPGNGFGLVAVEPDWTKPQDMNYESRPHNRITDNIIRSNRYWGVVLTNGSRAEVAHNIIAWNGDYSVDNDWTDIPDKSGGLLSLFTADQIIANDNKRNIQCPVILSNNIYGNKGYQIGVFTETVDAGIECCKQIYNSPVIMSNIIGVEENMPPLLTDDPPDQYDFLISAGPTPAYIVTPSPTNVSITPVTPAPTLTPKPCDSDYDFHGSGPIFAWNCYHDPTDGHQRRMYHPMQYNRWPPAVCTFTPTPTPRTPPPTRTPTPTPPTRTPNTPLQSPSHTPSTNTPIPTTGSPVPGYYEMGNSAWEVCAMRDNPQFVGWVSPTPGQPPEYDWHLRDYPEPGDPEKTPSNCYNRGGLDLNPGVTRSDGRRDTGWVDLGRHVKDMIPMVKHIDVRSFHDYDALIWSNPQYKLDGSLFHFHEIGGYYIYWGKLSDTSHVLTRVIIGERRPREASLTPFFKFSRHPNDIPLGAIFIGVSIYDTKFNESRIAWVPIPPPSSSSANLDN